MSHVVVLDYPGPEHERRIKSLGLGRHVLDEIRPREVALGRHVRQLVERTGGGRVVIAHCAAAVIGREFARLTGAARFIVVNPETPEPREVLELARTIMEDPALPEVTAARLADFEPVLVERYQRDLGGDLVLAEELASAQLDWVHHLAAAADPEAGAVLSSEVHLTSTDHECPAGCPAEHVRAAATAEEMFGSEQVRAFFAEEVPDAG
ncbi:hypothetical protein SAMN05421504_10128 [Amycolatopsis xylanica]|uniref:Uncharacterized protein n=1 Tax=Amycolatopsis xylanica TaxID=589385 RepID=A0A1H2RVC7_9PSEU|nr:hypothetical protein [Amycolatopsis xylanica]SDW23208.1 hypothetical protein SAMN05421504_10128 [Amycolatopsis xylanica]